jgi:hypothetical protein
MNIKHLSVINIYENIIKIKYNRNYFKNSGLYLKQPEYGLYYVEYKNKISG